MAESHFAVGPHFADLRPMHPATEESPFPVYPDLVDALLTAGAPDDVVRHVLAVCAGYAYGDERTVTMMMTRLGLPLSRCVMVREVVDAMFIYSTAYIVQSADGRVVIVCFRGTEPANLINWLTDLDIGPDQVRYDLEAGAGDERYRVHAGFYRNVRATRFAVIEVLQQALRGEAISAGPAAPGAGPALLPMERLFLTGHSLGAAMAALMTVMLRVKPIYAPIAEKLAATYTYGQPMIGTPEFARACSRATFGGHTTPLESMLFRYVYAADLVPQVPPRLSGTFAHFGTEFRCERLDPDVGPPRWTEPGRPTGQTNLPGLLLGGAALLTRSIRYLGNLPLRQSIVDHGPQNYIAALTPPHVRSEFGD